MALGHTNREIAERLSLSVRTVETHRTHVQQKLGSQAALSWTRYALEKRLIDPEPDIAEEGDTRGLARASYGCAGRAAAENCRHARNSVFLRGRCAGGGDACR